MLYRVVLDIAAAIILLTRIPVPWHRLTSNSPNLSLAQWAFPLVGALVGLLVGLVTVVFLHLGLNLIPAACLGIGFGTLITGGLHEDGLADTADGFGGGRTIKRKLEIMKDSSLGSYGTSALILTYFLRITLLASLSSYATIIFACIITACGGRTSMVILRKLSSPVSINSSASSLEPVKVKETLLSLSICSTFYLIYGPIFVIMGLCTVFMIPIFISWFAEKQIGGINGDILGACSQITEIFLFVLVAIWLSNA